MLLLTRQDSFFTPGHILKLKMLSQHDEGQISQKPGESSFCLQQMQNEGDYVL